MVNSRRKKNNDVAHPKAVVAQQGKDERPFGISVALGQLKLLFQEQLSKSKTNAQPCMSDWDGLRKSNEGDKELRGTMPDAKATLELRIRFLKVVISTDFNGNVEATKKDIG